MATVVALGDNPVLKQSGTLVAATVKSFGVGDGAVPAGFAGAGKCKITMDGSGATTVVLSISWTGDAAGIAAITAPTVATTADAKGFGIALLPGEAFEIVAPLGVKVTGVKIISAGTPLLFVQWYG